MHINTVGRLNVIYRTELDQKIVNRKKTNTHNNRSFLTPDNNKPGTDEV